MVFSCTTSPQSKLFKMNNYVLTYANLLKTFHRSGGRLHPGENQIDGFNGSILVEELVTQVSLKCYKISSKMEMGTSEMVCNTIKMNITKEMSMHDRVKGYKMKVASEKNIYGSLINDNFLIFTFIS